MLRYLDNAIYSSAGFFITGIKNFGTIGRPGKVILRDIGISEIEDIGIFGIGDTDINGIVSVSGIGQNVNWLFTTKLHQENGDVNQSFNNEGQRLAWEA